MPDLIPAEALQAAASAISRMLFSGQPEYGTWMEHDEDLARAAVEAAAPVLAAQARAQALRDVIAGRVTLDEQAAAQGITAPQRIEDLHTDLDLTEEEMEAFMAALNEPDVSEKKIRADERRKVAEEIAKEIESATPFHWTRSQARAWAARVARQMGEARG